MAKVAKVGVKKEKGYLYYLDKKGNVSMAKMARAGKKSKAKPKMVAKCGIKREAGYLYYIDKDGDVARAKMARGFGSAFGKTTLRIWLGRGS